MNISQKSCFRNKIKKSTGQLSCRAFQLSSSEHSWWISHIDLFCFFKLQDMDSSSYSFMAMYDKRLGLRIKQRTPNTAQCLNFIDVILQIPICYRRRNRKGNTNIKIHVQVHFTVALQFYVYVKVEFYVRIKVEIFLHALVYLYGGEKQVC